MSQSLEIKAFVVEKNNKSKGEEKDQSEQDDSNHWMVRLGWDSNSGWVIRGSPLQYYKTFKFLTLLKEKGLSTFEVEKCSENNENSGDEEPIEGLEHNQGNGVEAITHYLPLKPSSLLPNIESKTIVILY